MAGYRRRSRREMQRFTKRIPKRRTPYGRRADSCELIGDPHYISLNADWFAGARPIPMPRGRGARWLIRCPRCQVWRKTLYSRMGAALPQRVCRAPA
jgi:hypothetical protein